MKKLLLKQKVALSLTALVLVSLVLISFVTFLFFNKILIDNKKSEILSNSTEQVEKDSQIFKYNQLFVQMLADRALPREYLSEPNEERKTELLNIFKELLSKDKKYLTIYLLDSNGVGVVSTDYRFLNQNYSFRDYFKNSINGKPYVDVAVGKSSGQFGYYFSSPVFDSGNNAIGVMVLKVDPSFINESLAKSQSAISNTVMLTDSTGIVLYSNQEERNIKSLGSLSNEEKNKLISSERFLGVEIVPLQYDLVQQGVRDYTTPLVLDFFDKIDNEKEIMSILKIPDLPFFLITEIRLADVNSQIFNTVATIVLMLIIIFTIISFVIYLLLSYFVKPLDKFKIFFSQISKGDFSKEIEVDTKDEFHDLALSLNKMSKDLSGLYADLDSKVKEQTIKINNKILESENQNKAILNILEDVEIEKNNAENMVNDLNKFKLAVENASDQIVITDIEGIVIFGNKAVEKITGYKAEEALGKKAGVLWKAPMPEGYYANMWDVIKNKKETFVSEIQNKRKNGDVYTAIISISSVLDKHGNIIYFVALERDITKEKEVDRAKTEFVSLASHQLRTPLSAINWYTEMLLAGDAGAINNEQKQYLEEIAIGNKRMVDLVDDLLNVSRLDMGTFVMDTKSINVLDLLKSVINEAKSTILEKKLIIHESYDETLSLFSGDEKLMRMIFQNLISNAVKYIQPSGIIKIYLSKLKKDDTFGDKIITEDSLAFCVSDTGMGIPISQQGRIFSKLFRADNAKESETEGTGLGLYVVKSIVDKAGGLLWFKSEENVGSTFYVVFPIAGMKIKEAIIK